MPHTSKKYRKADTPKSSRTTTYIVVAIIAVIAVAGGFYAYAIFVGTSHSTTTSTSSTITQSGTISNSTSGLVYAKFDTSQGTFEVELFQSQTPKTVANFVSLAESGFYNNLVWHRIATNFVIQTGDPTTRNGQGSPCSWGTGTSNKTIPLEIVPSLHNYAGYLGMASPASGLPSSQFFINLSNNSASLDGRYTVFGKVISGMNVVDAIGSLAINGSCQGGATDGPPQNPQQAMLISVTILSSP
jgi:cyclophilin family peptidyl-prolyl cis-trans isomerase